MHTFHHPHEGPCPHYDPITQDCVLVTKDGEHVWEVTNYPIDGRNDGSREYFDVMYRIIQTRLKKITEIQEDEKAWGLLSGSTQHNLTVYKTQLETIPSEYVQGYVFPMVPAYDVTPLRMSPEYHDKAAGL